MEGPVQRFGGWHGQRGQRFCQGAVLGCTRERVERALTPALLVGLGRREEPKTEVEEAGSAGVEGGDGKEWSSRGLEGWRFSAFAAYVS